MRRDQNGTIVQSNLAWFGKRMIRTFCPDGTGREATH